MVGQIYQNISKVILSDLKDLSDKGISNIKKINVDNYDGSYQGYFYNLKVQDPKRYERLTFNTNIPSEPYSEDLTEMVMDFIICGFLDFDKNIRVKNLTEYLNSEQ